MSAQHQALSPKLLLRIALCLAVAAPAGFSGVHGQTLVQLTDLGSNMGPRLTRAVTRQRIDRSLFGSIGAKVSFVNSGTVYQFVTDPSWSRVVIGLKDQWVHSFTNLGGPGGPLSTPLGIDISARRRTYVADHAKGRIVVGTFDLSAGNITQAASWGSLAFPRPVDVAWDGRTTPLQTDFLYVVDDSLSTVSYWDLSGGAPGAAVWSYGGLGSGVGQFRHPSSVCVGKTVATSGGTQFTNDFYVVDRGNRRVVRLDRSSGPSWTSVASVSDWDPTDCTVDHFGHVLVVDESNHRIYKFTSSLSLLDGYGAYGRGANNLNTLAWPHSISVPCGLKVVNGQSVWYCEGRIITAEQWGDSSGAVEHYFGINSALSGPPTVGDPWAAIGFSSTDNAYMTADVWQEGVGGWNILRTLVNNSLWPAGQFQIYWDGTLENGQVAPDGNYLFWVNLFSAYGCPGGQNWCSRTMYSSQFFHRYCEWGGGGGNLSPPAAQRTNSPFILFRPALPPTCGEGGSYSIVRGFEGGIGIPSVFGVRQLPGVILGVADGLTPLASTQGIQASLSAGGADLNRPQDAWGALRAAVSEHGVSALQVNLPLATAVTIDVLDLSGRLVHRVEAGMQPAGMYVFRWGGTLDGGGRARPGVYLAVVRTQGRRAVSRLILTAAQAQ